MTHRPDDATKGATQPKRVFITGCSSGIGLDMARRCLAQGWRVVASCRRAEDLAARRAEGMETVFLDLADEASVTAAVAAVVDGGPVDTLVNNAAFALPGAVEDLPREGLRAIFETNLFGTHSLTRQIIPTMRARGRGRIVNISSVLGLVGIPWRGAYVASKFALEGLSDVLRIELSDTPIKVILIEPGPVTSQIRRNSIPHFERWINWQHSARRADYESGLLQRLYGDRGPDRYELPPSAVSDRLMHAIDHPRPRARYYVTRPTWYAAIGRRILPTPALDWFAKRG